MRPWLMQTGTATGFKCQTFVGSTPTGRTNINIVMKKILILIDAWERKENIITFLERISNDNEWTILYNSTNHPMDPSIQQVLDNSCNAFAESDALLVYDIKEATTFYYTGFHANHCLFHNAIGIDKYLEIAPKSLSDLFVVDELTCALTINGPVAVPGLVFSHDAMQNYRKILLTDILISVNTV